MTDKTCRNCKSALAYWEAIDCGGYYLCPPCYEHEMIRHRAWYYDWTDGSLSNDQEGNLTWLCDDCACELSDQVSHASEDSLNDSACWRCGR